MLSIMSALGSLPNSDIMSASSPRLRDPEASALRPFFLVPRAAKDRCNAQGAEYYILGAQAMHTPCADRGDFREVPETGMFQRADIQLFLNMHSVTIIQQNESANFKVFKLTRVSQTKAKRGRIRILLDLSGCYLGCRPSYPHWGLSRTRTSSQHRHHVSAILVT